MKTLGKALKRGLNPRVLVVSFAITMMSSCIVITDEDYGPHGDDGRAYFAIDYDFNPPYSYWDNNPSMPNNPFFGEYYRTMDGTYNFEYFINPYDYWYGTYTIHINRGEDGQPFGVAGADGADTYLMLICNDDGFYFEGWEDCFCTRTEMEDGTIILEKDLGDKKMRVEMKKTNIDVRPTQNVPKYKR